MIFRRMAPAIILFLLLCGCGANGNVNLPEDHGRTYRLSCTSETRCKAVTRSLPLFESEESVWRSSSLSFLS